jgi:hypothetical protein
VEIAQICLCNATLYFLYMTLKIFSEIFIISWLAFGAMIGTKAESRKWKLEPQVLRPPGTGSVIICTDLDPSIKSKIFWKPLISTGM